MDEKIDFILFKEKMMRAFAGALLTSISLLLTQAAMAADESLLSPVFTKVQQTDFGVSQNKIALETKAFSQQNNLKIITLPFSLSEFPASLNYLFDPRGRLYNLAWLVIIPAEKIQAAMSLDDRMMQE
jgi:hypothetical protein